MIPKFVYEIKEVTKAPPPSFECRFCRGTFAGEVAYEVRWLNRPGYVCNCKICPACAAEALRVIREDKGVVNHAEKPQ